MCEKIWIRVCDFVFPCTPVIGNGKGVWPIKTQATHLFKQVKEETNCIRFMCNVYVLTLKNNQVWIIRLIPQFCGLSIYHGIYGYL